MIDITHLLPGMPTPEDVERAKKALRALKAAGKMYVSDDPKVFGMQARCYARTYLMQRGEIKIPVAAPAVDWVEKTENEKAMERDHQISRLLMGRESIYSEVSHITAKETKVVKHLFENFHYQDKRNILILGDVGSGKTYGGLVYMVSQANLWFNVEGTPRTDAHFVRAYTVSEAIQRKAWAQIDAMREYKWLMIDDLGAEGGGWKGADFVNFFEDLFIERHQNRKHTLITSNATLEQVRETFGERFISRLRETGEVFQTDDPDFRRGGD